MNPEEAMTTITIERKITLPPDAPFDAKLTMEWEGVVAKSIPEGGAVKKAGLKAGDIIVAIMGNPIRYTPLNIVLEKLKKDVAREITIRRKVNIFKST